MASDKNEVPEEAKRLIKELFQGNPILDEQAFERALSRMPDERSRSLLRDLRETAFEQPNLEISDLEIEAKALELEKMNDPGDEETPGTPGSGPD